MKDIIIVGNGICATMMLSYIASTNFGNIVAFVVDEEFITEPYINDVPVISIEEMKKFYSVDNVRLVMGIGYSQMGDIRKEMFNRLKDLGYKFTNYIHPTAIICTEKIGEGNVILEGAILGINSSIGDANLIYSGALVGHNTELGNYNTMSVHATIAGCSKIHNNCFLGNSSMIRDSIEIGDYVLIGEGACAFKSIPENTVVKSAKSIILEDTSSRDIII